MAEDRLGFWSGALDKAQVALDVAGVADPTPIADGTNALIHLARGNWGDAGISAVGMVPYVGDLAKGARYVGKAADMAKSANQLDETGTGFAAFINRFAAKPDGAGAIVDDMAKTAGAPSGATMAGRLIRTPIANADKILLVERLGAWLGADAPADERQQPDEERQRAAQDSQERLHQTIATGAAEDGVDVSAALLSQRAALDRQATALPLPSQEPVRAPPPKPPPRRWPQGPRGPS